MKEWRFLTQSLFFRNWWGCAADNLWTFVTWHWHKLWLCCTVQSSFEPFSVPVRRVQDESRCKLGATAVYEIARGCLRTGKLSILYNIELRVCPDQKTALQEHLMPSLIPAIQEISTITLLCGDWCLLPVWSGVQKLNLFVEISRSGWIFCSIKNTLSLSKQSNISQGSR